MKSDDGRPTWMTFVQWGRSTWPTERTQLLAAAVLRSASRRWSIGDICQLRKGLIGNWLKACWVASWRGCAVCCAWRPVGPAERWLVASTLRILATAWTSILRRMLPALLPHMG